MEGHGGLEGMRDLLSHCAGVGLDLLGGHLLDTEQLACCQSLSILPPLSFCAGSVEDNSGFPFGINLDGDLVPLHHHVVKFHRLHAPNEKEVFREAHP